MEHDQSSALHFTLPTLIVSPTDVSRVRRELDALDEYLEAQKIREPGLPVQRLPKTSRLLDDLATLNKLNLLHATVRQDVKVYLHDVQEHAPVVHVSFAAEPSSAALDKIVQWLRRNTRADVLVRVGVQPNIVAGCVVRTTNRSFDLSLRRYLHEKREVLFNALNATYNNHAEPVVANEAEVAHG